MSGDYLVELLPGGLLDILGVGEFLHLRQRLAGQLGPRVIGRMPEQTLIRSLGWIFLGIAALTAYEALG